MKYNILIALGLSFMMASGGFSMTEGQARGVIQLLKNNQTTFCGKGTFTKTIRSSSGKYCAPDIKYASIGPALAFGACWNHSDSDGKKFSVTDCGNSIQELKRKSPNLKLGTEGDVIKLLAQSEIKNVCEFVAMFLPKLKDQCLAAGTPPERPSYPASPSGRCLPELTETQVSGLASGDAVSMYGVNYVLEQSKFDKSSKVIGDVFNKFKSAKYVNFKTFHAQEGNCSYYVTDKNNNTQPIELMPKK